MEIVTALALRKQKKLCTESYLTRSSHFQRCPSGAFRSARVTNSIKIEDQPNDQTLRKSPTYWTGSKSIFWLMMKTIIVHTKYVPFTTRPLHLINPHICVWVTLYVKHKRFLFMIFGFFGFLGRFFCAAPLLTEHLQPFYIPFSRCTRENIRFIEISPFG